MDVCTIEVKTGLGTVSRTHEPIRLYHVVVEGKTKASMPSLNDAKLYVFDYMIGRPFQTYKVFYS